jgi:membrane fusion protein, multidrug efflux system
MAIVPLDQVWVDANFKERQLANIRLGQPVSLHADVYGDKVEFHGTVSGLGAGTGSAFSLLPAQNATGNWIKVVQRLPVRIALAKQELAAHPLRVGLSMDVDVDTHDRSDSRLLPDAHRKPVYQTRVFDRQQQAADAFVARIIAANLTVKSPPGNSTQTTIADQGKPEPLHVARQVPVVSRDGS